MSRPRKPVVSLAEAAQSVLARWAEGDLAEAVRELDRALKRHRKAGRRRKPRPFPLRLDGGRHDRR